MYMEQIMKSEQMAQEALRSKSVADRLPALIGVIVATAIETINRAAGVWATR